MKPNQYSLNSLLLGLTVAAVAFAIAAAVAHLVPLGGSDVASFLGLAAATGGTALLVWGARRLRLRADRHFAAEQQAAGYASQLAAFLLVLAAMLQLPLIVVMVVMFRYFVRS